MAMDGTEKVLLSLGIRSMDPAEVRRLGQMTGDQLSNELRSVYARLEALHKAHKAAQTAEEAKAVQAQIKEQQKLGQSVEKIVKQQQVALNKMHGSWRRTLEDIENITVAAQGMAAAVSGIVSLAGRAKQFADEMIRTTNIFVNAKGSIEGMKEASDGQIRSMDLILARNKAFQLEFKPTEKQFNLLAEAADAIGDATGTNATEGLNKLVEGLALGKEKTIELIVGKIDLVKVYDDFAKRLGTTSDKLTEQGKLTAFQEEAFKRLAETVGDFSGKQKTAADLVEQSMTRVADAWDQVVLAIGSSGLLFSFLEKAAETLREAKWLYDQFYGKNSVYVDPRLRAMMDERPKTDEQMDAELFKSIGAETTRRQGLVTPKKANPGDAKRAADERGRRALQAFEHDIGVDRRMEDVADKRQFEEMDKRFRESAGPDADFTRAMDSIGSGDVNALTEQLSAGAMAAEQWKAATGGAFDSVAASAQMMAGAAGEALAAMVVGLKDTSFKDRANQVMRALAAEAYTRSIMETALGLASLALGPIGGVSAGMHFAAAGAFAAVGTAAGLGARSLGPMASERGGRGGTTSVPTRSSGSGLPSGRTSGGSSDGDKSPIIMNFNNVLPGSEAEIGRVIEKSLEAHYRKSGRRPVN